MHAHPDDIDLLLESRLDRTPRPDRPEFDAMLQAVLEVAHEIEGQLAWTTRKERARWLTLTVTLRNLAMSNDIGMNQIGGVVDAIKELSKLAHAAWLPPTDGPARLLPFIHDAALRAIAERDLAALDMARKAELTKVALVLAGSVIEAAILDVLERDARTEEVAKKHALAKGNLSRWSLEQKIAVCGPSGLGVLTHDAEKIANAARNYRNYVHPNKERTQPVLHISDASLAAALMDKILEEIRRWVDSQRQ